MLFDDSSHLEREDTWEQTWAQWFELMTANDIQVKDLETFQSYIKGTDFASLELNLLVMMLSSPTMHRLISPGPEGIHHCVILIPYSIFITLYPSLYSFSGRTQSDQELGFESCLLWKIYSSLECRKAYNLYI